MPARVDIVRLARGAHGAGGWLQGVTQLARAALLLYVAVGWGHALLAAALGAPLPPALHLALTAASAAHLCARAPQGAGLPGGSAACPASAVLPPQLTPALCSP